MILPHWKHCIITKPFDTSKLVQRRTICGDDCPSVGPDVFLCLASGPVGLSSAGSLCTTTGGEGFVCRKKKNTTLLFWINLRCRQTLSSGCEQLTRFLGVLVVGVFGPASGAGLSPLGVFALRAGVRRFPSLTSTGGSGVHGRSGTISSDAAGGGTAIAALKSGCKSGSCACRSCTRSLTKMPR